MMNSRPLFHPPKKTCQSATGSILASETNFYTVESVMKRGAIAQVVKCKRIDNSKPVMIKMIKNHPSYLQAAHTEVEMLVRLRQLDPKKSHLVRWYQVFNDRAFTCLLFEPVETNLLVFMKQKHSYPLALKIIRPIIKQVASALHYLKSVNIIHANLRLENVMLVQRKSQPWRVKVFDFSQAHLISASRQGQCIQPLPYRSPEIILGLSYNTAVDIWSLGCIAAALYLGTLLYRGKSTYEMLKHMVQIQGQPPDTLLNLGLRTRQYFIRDASSGTWRLKSHWEYFQKRHHPLRENRPTVLSSLQDFLILRPQASHSPSEMVAEMIHICLFVALLKGMLHLDGADRLTPHQVLQHPFISMQHPFYNQSPSAKFGGCTNTWFQFGLDRRTKEGGNLRGASQLLAGLDNRQRKTKASLWTCSSRHESKVDPTNYALKRKMSKEPNTEPHRKRVHLACRWSSSTQRDASRKVRENLSETHEKC